MHSKGERVPAVIITSQDPREDRIISPTEKEVVVITIEEDPKEAVVMTTIVVVTEVVKTTIAAATEAAMTTIEVVNVGLMITKEVAIEAEIVGASEEATIIEVEEAAEVEHTEMTTRDQRDRKETASTPIRIHLKDKILKITTSRELLHKLPNKIETNSLHINPAEVHSSSTNLALKPNNSINLNSVQTMITSMVMKKKDPQEEAVEATKAAIEEEEEAEEAEARIEVVSTTKRGLHLRRQAAFDIN